MYTESWDSSYGNITQSENDGDEWTVGACVTGIVTVAVGTVDCEAATWGKYEGVDLVSDFSWGVEERGSHLRGGLR